MGTSAADILEKSKNWEMGQLTMADGWQVRTAFWKMAKPAEHRILMHPGRGEMIEKRTLRAQKWAELGVQPMTFEWRGQGGSGRILPDEPLKCHVDSFDTYARDLKEVWNRFWLPGQTASGRNFVEGHSLGAHMMLRHLGSNNDLGKVERGIIEAPLVNIPLPLPATLAYPIVQAMGALQGQEYALNQSPDSAKAKMRKQFANNPYTSDEESFNWHRDLVAARPDLALGGVTWGWVAAAMRSHQSLMQVLPDIKLPLLAILTTNDRVVDPRAQQEVRKIAGCQVMELPESRHEVFIESPQVRAKEWGAIRIYLRL